MDQWSEIQMKKMKVVKSQTNFTGWREFQIPCIFANLWS